MNHDMENKLISCLELLEQGESVENILAQFPADAEALRPFLETAAQLPDLASRPTLATQQQSQAAFLAQAASLVTPQSAPVPFWVTLRRILMPVASLAIVLIFLSIGLISVSATALPGDGLYSVKRTVETFRLQNASDPEQILELSEQARQERLREVEALLRAGRAAGVMFEGEIGSIDDTAWIIAGLKVQLDKATIIDGTPQVGELAMVDGRTSDGLLLASKIMILIGAPEAQETPRPVIIPLVEPEDTPEPSTTLAATPTPSPSPTPTATPTATPSPTPTQLPTETVELAPLPPTSTPSDAPVAPPPPAENDNENDGQDDGNDNGLNDDDNDGGDDSNNNDSDGDNNNDGDVNNDNDGDNTNDNDDDNTNDDDGKENGNDNEDVNENDGDHSGNDNDDERNENDDEDNDNDNANKNSNDDGD